METKEKMEKQRKRRVYFTYEDPDAGEVAVTGSFCDWKDGYLLKRDKKGIWKTSVWIQPGRYEYRFLVDGRWCGDPVHRERVPNSYGGENDVMVVTA
jgi:1,4-alpha-glucan branching enzyme